jgi:hypothetical protein
VLNKYQPNFDFLRDPSKYLIAREDGIRTIIATSIFLQAQCKKTSSLLTTVSGAHGKHDSVYG